jgi:NAD/NADP transhydrogenase beta subunit
MRRLTLTTTVVVTTIAIGGIAYGVVRTLSVTGMDAVAAGLVAWVTLLLVGVPAALMWFHTVRVLRGNSPRAWRVHDELAHVAMYMIGAGVPSTLFTGQLVAFGFLIGAFVVVQGCKVLLKRVLIRDRVGPPPPNWMERRFGRAGRRLP